MRPEENGFLNINPKIARLVMLLAQQGYISQAVKLQASIKENRCSASGETASKNPLVHSVKTYTFN